MDTNNHIQVKVLPKVTDNNSIKHLHPKVTLNHPCSINSTAVTRPSKVTARLLQASTARLKVNIAPRPHHRVMLLPLDSIISHRRVNMVRLQVPPQVNMVRLQVPLQVNTVHHHRKDNTGPRHRASMEPLHRVNMLLHPKQAAMAARQPNRLSVTASRQPTLT